MFDILSIVEILKKLKIYLTQLNNRQRYYIVSRVNNKNDIVVATLFKFFDVVIVISKISAIFEASSKIFTRSRENILTTFISRLNHISKL